ncbi:MAG: hypothetical protein IPI67_11495 [Myxococcales bacterium]|nr:hypothetical protein [Myxococcales bacterium]
MTTLHLMLRSTGALMLALGGGVGCGGSLDSDGGGTGGQAGGGGSSGGGGGGGGTGGSVAVGGGGASGSGATGGTGATGGAPSDCQALAEAISNKVDPGVGSCTAVVRVGHVDNTISGYKIVCGKYAQVDEATAFKQATLDSGVGNSCFGTSSITGAKPEDNFVFFQPASAAACACCGDGWVTAVSARAGVTALGATINLGASGGLVYPASWDAPSELGTNCGLSGLTLTARGFDLTPLGSPGTPPAALSQAALEKVMAVVMNTALPAGLGKKGYLFDAVVLLYSPLAGAQDKAEWLVLLNSGWLE